MSAARRVLRGRLAPEDAAAARYHYVPFEVGLSARAVSVHLGIEPPEAVIDLGVFDPQGFRGYSGGARDRFVITQAEATPGYLPGDLTPGEWRIILGLHKVPSAGVSFALTVSTAPAQPEPLPPAPPPGRRPPPRDLPAERGRRWIGCDLHTHTVHSDGALTPAALAARAGPRGLDLVAVTDHNTISHHRTLTGAGRGYGVELFPGQEVTTAEGHLSCLGDIGWVDFRDPPRRWVETALERGGISAVTHPTDPELGWRLGPCDAPLTEVWNGRWDRLSSDPFEWWDRSGGTPVGGSDFHRPGEGRELGSPTTWIEVEDGAGPLDGLRAGRVMLSCDPSGPVIVRRDGDIDVIDGDGAVLATPDGESRRVSSERARFALGDGPFRLAAPDGRTVAFTP